MCSHLWFLAPDCTKSEEYNRIVSRQEKNKTTVFLFPIWYLPRSTATPSYHFLKFKIFSDIRYHNVSFPFKFELTIEWFCLRMSMFDAKGRRNCDILSFESWSVFSDLEANYWCWRVVFVCWLKCWLIFCFLSLKIDSRSEKFGKEKPRMLKTFDSLPRILYFGLMISLFFFFYYITLALASKNGWQRVKNGQKGRQNALYGGVSGQPVKGPEGHVGQDASEHRQGLTRRRPMC